MLQGMTILMVFLFIGEVIALFFVLPIPGNVMGFILLFAALSLKVVKLHQVEEAAKLLLDNLALFFVPPGVGIMQYFGIIKNQWLPIIVSIVISTIFVLIATAKTAELLKKGRGRNVQSS